MGGNGVVAWMLCVKADKYPYLGSKWDSSNLKHDVVIYNVRDPMTSIPSIIHTEDTKRLSVSFRSTYGGFKRTENRVENAMLSLIAWDELITTLNPDYRWRIEDEGENLFAWLKQNGFDVKWNEKVIGHRMNIRDHDGWSEDLQKELKEVSETTKNKMNRLSAEWGYQTRF